jgi:hypothetical protein
MVRNLMFAGVATAALGFGGAHAQTMTPRDTTGSQQGATQPGAQGTRPGGSMGQSGQAGQPGQMGQSGQMGRTGQMGQQTAMPIAGVVTMRDSSGLLTVIAPLADTTQVSQIGQNAYVVDPGEKIMALEGKPGEGATITKDGKTARASELKEGDFVRATWNAQSQTFTRIEATSPKELRKESKQGMQNQGMQNQGMQNQKQPTTR